MSKPADRLLGLHLGNSDSFFAKSNQKAIFSKPLIQHIHPEYNRDADHGEGNRRMGKIR